MRELARENATGRLRLTQNGKIREILIESGVPVFASSTIPEEQPEHKLVQDGLITPEQLSAALVTARQTSQPVEKILVQRKALTRLGLQRILCELSTTIVNSASAWITGEYAFAAARKVPLEAKLIWSPTECILAGARHASSKNSVLDALAPDELTVIPASDAEATAADSASLSSTEGYVLSCIQSPTTIAEASMLTGLSHIETRRAILVLIMLGLLEAEPSAKGRSKPVTVSEPEVTTLSAGITSKPASRPSQESGPAPRPAKPAQPVIDSGRPPAPQPQSSSSSLGRSGAVTAQMPLNNGTPATKGPANHPSEAWPLDLGSAGYAGLDDDSSEIDLNSGDISFLDFQESSKPSRDAQRERPHQSPDTHARRNGDNEGIASLHKQSVPEQQAPAPVSAASTVSSRDRGTGSIFIPNSARQQVPGNGKNNSIFIPDTASQTPQARGSAPIPADSAVPARETNGSIFIPSGAVPPAQPPVDSTTAAKPAAPARGNTGFIPGWAVPREQGVARTNPPPRQPSPAAASEPGYGWNGESDPRLHQEWRNQQEAAARQDNADDERFLKRVIDELGAKIRFSATADYYQILGVDKLASNGSITKAYERITRINDSHKSRWPYNTELQSQISSLMAVVNKAYDMLGSPEKRRLYDMPPKQQSPVMEIERGTGSVTGPIGARTTPPPPARPSPAASPSRPLPGGPPLASPNPTPVDNRNPIEAAADLYRRGRGAFARSDLQAAAHLLRQAVNLDPQQSTYHYQLGMTLFILSQARAEHKHDKGCHVTCKMGGNLTRNQRIRHEAEQHLLKASELEPSNSDIKLKLALLYKDAHMDRKAHQYFYEALMLDPNCHIARVELGMEDGRKKESAEDQWIKDLMKDRTKKK
jgi:tetratricopeptide (TPR) repeat protein